ncbi:MAG: YcxB family protein [Bacilli bacterium]|nr:YcxB family protein [Bacilli bacterium]
MKKNKKSAHNMNYLYKVSMSITEKDFIKYQKFFLNIINKGIIGEIIIIILAFLVLLFEIYRKNILLIIITCLFILIYPILLDLSLKRQIKRMFKNNFRVNDRVGDIYFYKDYIESNSSFFNNKIKYEDIKYTYELNKYIYIFVDNNLSLIINKNNLKKELLDLLKDKTIYKRFYL